MQDIAIVGAGAAGASATYALRESPADVTVFEKSRGVCGRAATRRGNGCIYDYGANYIKDDDADVTRLVTEVLDTDGLVDVTDPIWTFDATGRVDEGTRRDRHRWSYRTGITQFAKRLFDRTDATVEFETRVEHLERDEGWRLRATDGTDLGGFDAVLVTPPAPQTAVLLGSSEWDHPTLGTLQTAAAAVDYRTVYSAVLHYPFELDVPYYALVNTDKQHAVGWVSREECKPGHVPDGESLLVAQMGPEWSTRRYDDDPENVVADAATHVADLLGDGRLRSPDWTDDQGWRYALPEGGIEDSVARRAEDHGLYLAGDWVAGDGRVHAAARTGLAAGRRMAGQE